MDWLSNRLPTAVVVWPVTRSPQWPSGVVPNNQYAWSLVFTATMPGFKLFRTWRPRRWAGMQGCGRMLLPGIGCTSKM
jgi:hypothetical protein